MTVELDRDLPHPDLTLLQSGPGRGLLASIRGRPIGRLITQPGAFDESLVVCTECGSGELFFEAVGNASAIETVLQLAIPVVEHDAHCVARSNESW